MSFRLRKQLKDILQSCQKNITLSVFSKPSKRIKSTFRFKDISPKHIISKDLYKFKYDTCNIVFIDKNKQHPFVRQYEHLGLSLFTEKALKYREKIRQQSENIAFKMNIVIAWTTLKLLGLLLMTST